MALPVILGRLALAAAPMALGSLFNGKSGANAQSTGPSLFNRATDGALGVALGNTAEMLIPGEQEGFGAALGMAGAAGAFNEAGSDENSSMRMLGAVGGIFLAHMALTSMGMDPNSLTSQAIMGVAGLAGATLVGRMTDATPAAAPATQQALPAPAA